jgi:penicillin-binding protein 2
MIARKRNKKNQGVEVDMPLISESDAEELEYSGYQDSFGKVNFYIFGLLLVITGVILIGRVAFLQIVQGSYYQNLAEGNRIRNQVIKAPRGLIVDKNGKVLVKNVPGFDVVFIPRDIFAIVKNKQIFYKKVADVLSMNEESVKSVIESEDKNSGKSFLLKQGLEHEEALALMEKIEDIPGVRLEETAHRQYVEGEVFSSIIGYTGKISPRELENHPDYLLTDVIGKRGLEYTYEKWLRGENGKSIVEVDSRGNVKENLGFSPPESGSKLVLNLDSDLQKYAYEFLQKLLKENEAAEGAALVAVNPQDGAVLSLASLPGYDNNLFVGGIESEEYNALINDPRKLMTNKAVSEAYPPGSVFKPLVGVAALEEDLISKNTEINCPGSISIGSWTFNDWKTHGRTDLKKAIAESCNVYFYSLGGGWKDIDGLGPDKMSKHARNFGLGNLLGIDLTNETSGVIPDKEWKFQKTGEKWYTGDSYHMAIGQGFVTVTPLQMAVATSAIANGGKVFRPQLVDKIIDSDGRAEDLKKELLRERFVSLESIRIIKEAMRETVISGSGASMNDMDTPVSGKTGTAQFGGEDKTHSWFISFAPFENPEIAMAIIIQGGGEGHDWAVPATEAVLRKFFEEEEEEFDFNKTKEGLVEEVSEEEKEKKEDNE